MRDLEVKAICNTQAQHYIKDLAYLRMEIFQEYPYLYQGNLDDEKKVVGASIVLPLVHETSNLQSPFETLEFQKNQILYLDRSVLLSAYRGYGIGYQFFNYREAHAQKLGLSTMTLCSVQRAQNHPMRSEGYRSHHTFWKSRGYIERSDIPTQFFWRDLNNQEETAKTMRFWPRNYK